MYVLVILQPEENADAEPRHAPAHVEFVSSMIKRNVVLLGGAFSEPIDDAPAAYLLRCRDLEEATRITAEDPYVVNGVTRPRFVEWQLVGVNPEAIEIDDVVRPGDV
jgi:uncharacterized protein YciI